MFCFRRKDRLPLLFLLLTTFAWVAGRLPAATVNYAADPQLASTAIDPRALPAGSVPLAELLSAIERQMSLRFLYDADRVPVGSPVRLASQPQPRSLAGILAELSGQAEVVFHRRGNLIGVWNKGPDDVVVGESGATPEVLAGPAGVALGAPGAPEILPPAFEEPLPRPAAAEDPLLAVPGGTPDSGASGGVVEMEQFRVEGKPDPNSQGVLRQRAAVAVDLISSRDFSKFIATDVADIVVRMPGFSTTTRGSFAVIRGLAERYNPILLDGIPLPSSDPERQTPELDLFPTRLVDTIVVNKVFESRLPGTSSGGAVDLRTKPLPEGRYGQVQFGLRADEGALQGEDFLRSNYSGLWDHLAAGAKDRPTAPANGAEFFSRARNPGTQWAGYPGSFPLGARASVVYENRHDLGGDQRAFGYSFSLGYDSSASAESGRVLGTTGTPVSQLPALVRPDGTLVSAVQGEDYLEYEREVRLGGLVNLGYAFNTHHTLAASYFFSQVGIDTVGRSVGYADLNVNTAAQLDLLYEALDSGKTPAQFAGLREQRLDIAQTMNYRQRELSDFKVSGTHQFGAERATRVDWAVANIQASQEDPDFSFLSYEQAFPVVPGVEPLLVRFGQPLRQPTRFWRDVREESRAFRLDAEHKFGLGWMPEVSLRGGLYQDKTRRAYRQEAYVVVGGANAFGDNFEELLDSFRASDFNARIATPAPAAADQEREIRAAYVSLNLPFLADRPWARKLDLAAGVRLERYDLAVSGSGVYGNQSSADYYTEVARGGSGRLPADFIDPNRPPAPFTVFSRDLAENTTHPSVALTWSPVERLNVRLAFSKTVARPSFRELGPYFTSDEVTNEIQHGNVTLNTSRVENTDFRVEYFFPRSRDLVALSLFSKTIAQPIEKQADVLVGGGFTALGWFNNPNDAEIKGAELEFAKNFGFLGEVGSWFTLGGNGTFIDAVVGAGPGEGLVPGTERRLFDQPEWIGNAYLTFDQPQLGFSTTLSWFAISDVLRSVSRESWSTYVAAHDRLDLSLSQHLGRGWHLRLTARNLTDPDRKFIADPEVTTEEVVLRRYRDGRSYSLTTSYEF